MSDHNAVCFMIPNFYMLCNDLLSVVDGSFGISNGFFFRFNFCAFFTEMMTSQQEVENPFGVYWVPLVLTTLYRKKWGFQMVFLFPWAHWGLFYIYGMF